MRFGFTTSGESHGPAEVALVNGVPAGLGLLAEDINRDLARRQQGYGRGGRQKIEKDQVEFLGGVRHGDTLGSPIAMMVRNRDYANWESRMTPDPVEEPPTPITLPPSPSAVRRFLSRPITESTLSTPTADTFVGNPAAFSRSSCNPVRSLPFRSRESRAAATIPAEIASP